MNSNWPEVRLRDHVELLLGFAFPSKGFRQDPSGIRLLRGDNITEGSLRWGEKARYWPNLSSDIERYLLRAGDVVIGMDGSKVGRNWSRIRDTDLPCLLVQRVACLRSKETVIQDFLPCLIGSQRFVQHVDAIKTGSSIPHISGSQIGEFTFRLPTLPEQSSIVSLVNALDDKIELNRRMNETLESATRTIFQSWFLHFGPTQTISEGRHQVHVPAQIRELFGSALVSSPAGFRPAGWDCKPFPQVFDINPSRVLEKSVAAAYVDMSNLPTNTARVLGWIERPFSSGTRFKNGDTLLARITPCLENGKTAFVDFLRNGDVGWGSTEFIVLRPKPPLPTHYGYFLARSDQFRSFAIANMSGSSGRQRVPNDCFQNLFVAVPPQPVGEAFGRIAEATFAKMKQNDDESRTLAELKATLVPKLLSGEVHLGKAEKSIGALV